MCTVVGFSARLAERSQDHHGPLKPFMAIRSGSKM